MDWLTLFGLIALPILFTLILHATGNRRWYLCGAAGAVLLLVCIAVGVDSASFQVLKFMCLPVAVLWLMLIGCATACFVHKQKAIALMLTGLAVLVWVSGSRWFGMELMRGLEQRISAFTPLDQERFDCVCILGGGIVRKDGGLPQFSASGDRLRVAAEIYQRGRAKWLFASGTFAPDTQSMLAAFGVPEAAVITDVSPYNTAGEIAAIKQQILKHNWERVGVVSSAWHLPRALKLAAAQGVPLIPIPADAHGIRTEAAAIFFVPCAYGLWDTELAIKEYAGLWLSL